MSASVTTRPVPLAPTPDQAALLRAHCQESLRTVQVLVQALDSGVWPDDGRAGRQPAPKTAPPPCPAPSSTRPSLRDARAVWKRSFARGSIPILRKPLGQWNNQHWRLEQGNEGDTLIIPV